MMLKTEIAGSIVGRPNKRFGDIRESESRVLSVIMWHKWADGFPGQTAALGVVLIVALAVLTVIGRTMVNRLSRRQED